MILSTENSFLRNHVGERDAIEMLAKAGFDAIDYGFAPDFEYERTSWNTNEYLSYAKEVMKIAEDNGVYFNQAHGPFMFDTSLFPNYEKQVLPLYQRCFEVCALLKIPHVIVHPVHHLPYLGNEKLMWDMNMEFYHLLLPHAKEYGVKISLENLYQYDPRRGCMARDILSNPEEYARFYDTLNDPNVICCVDLGHCTIVGDDVSNMLRTMGNRVKALHVNDNLFRTDDHVIPGHGLMNWEDITKTLAEIDYSGDFTYEILSIYRYGDRDFLETSVKYLHDVGRHMIRKIEKYKAQLDVGGKVNEDNC